MSDVLPDLGTDALKWTDEFMKANPGADAGAMLAWFANAIEAARDAGRREMCPHAFSDLFISGDLIICGACGKGLAS